MSSCHQCIPKLPGTIRFLGCPLPYISSFWKQVSLEWTSGNSQVLLIILYLIGMAGVSILCKVKILGSPETIHDSVLTKIKFWFTKNRAIKSFLEPLRGDNYMLDRGNHATEKSMDNARQKKRMNKSFEIMSIWSFFHMMFYMILGFVSPKNWWLMVLVGIGWEMFEIKDDCFDIMDVVWNSIGMVIGIALRYKLMPPDKTECVSYSNCRC